MFWTPSACLIDVHVDNVVANCVCAVEALTARVHDVITGWRNKAHVTWTQCLSYASAHMVHGQVGVRDDDIGRHFSRVLLPTVPGVPQQPDIALSCHASVPKPLMGQERWHAKLIKRSTLRQKHQHGYAKKSRMLLSRLTCLRAPRDRRPQPRKPGMLLFLSEFSSQCRIIALRSPQTPSHKWVGSGISGQGRNCQGGELHDQVAWYRPVLELNQGLNCQVGTFSGET